MGSGAREQQKSLSENSDLLGTKIKIKHIQSHEAIQNVSTFSTFVDIHHIHHTHHPCGLSLPSIGEATEVGVFWIEEGGTAINFVDRQTVELPVATQMGYRPVNIRKIHYV